MSSMTDDNADDDIRSIIEARRNRVDERLGIFHRYGVWWHEAPLPRRLHRCSPWTTSLEQGIERCACGAIRNMHRRRWGWMERNSRRKGS